MKAEEIAQWVINNRYPKSEKEKIEDAEMYYFIVDAINKLNKSTDNEIMKEQIIEILEKYNLLIDEGTGQCAISDCDFEKVALDIIDF